MTTLMLLAGAVLVVYVSQKFVRDWWFHRKNYQLSDTAKKPNFLACPVDGTIVYVKEVTDGQVTTSKQGRVIEEDWVDGQNGYLIGIYMCVYDRHFIISPVGDFVAIEHRPTLANLPMMDLWEYINFYFVGRFVDWFEEKAFDYKLRNEKVIYRYASGIRMMGIADKFVNKIEIPKFLVWGTPSGEFANKGDKVGHIRRGSQVDLFIPKHMADCIVYTEGEKVKVGDAICRLKS